MATTKAEASKKAEKTFIQKIIEVQQELKAPKGQSNDFGHYKYRSAEDIIKAVKPLLHERGLALFITDTVQVVGNRYYIIATVQITNGEDERHVTAMAREEESKKGMDASQITGTASSYARKYALCGLLAIDGTNTKDADALNISEEYTQPSDEAVKAAVSELNMATTPNELNNAWNRHADLQGNKEFLTTMQVRCSEFRNK